MLSDDRPMIRRRTLDAFRRFVRHYQHHPAVLMYLIGNEPNLHNTPSSLLKYWHMVEMMSEIRDEECANTEWHNTHSLQYDSWQPYNHHLPSTSSNQYAATITSTFTCYHPISVPIADNFANLRDMMKVIGPLEIKYRKAVDIWSFQVYRGTTFASFFQFYQYFLSRTRSTKPILITEYGCDIMDFREEREHRMNSSMQSSCLMSQFHELATLPAFSVGGLIFEYLDEWWKSSEYAEPMEDGCPVDAEQSALIHANCGRKGKMDDGFYSEAFFGLFGYAEDEAGNHDNSAMCIVPRQAYFDLMNVWRGTNWSVADMHLFCADQKCCAYKDMSDVKDALIIVGAIVLLIALYALKRWCVKRNEQDHVNDSHRKNNSNNLNQFNSHAAYFSLKHKLQLLPTKSELQIAKSSLYQWLHPIFQSSFVRLHLSLYPHLQHSHVSLQCSHFVSSLLDCLLRTGSISYSISLVHLRLFEGYKAWCRHVHATEQFLQPIDDICDYLLIYSMAEQLRRVPSYIHERFHYRAIQSNAHLINPTSSLLSLSTRLSLTPSALQQHIQSGLDHYAYGYDELDDICRQSHQFNEFKPWLTFYHSVYTNVREPFAYPNSGG